MSEPCHNCERLTVELAALQADYARDAIQNVVAVVQAYGAAKRALDEALATIERVKAAVKARERYGEDVPTEEIWTALEPTDQPKGKP